MSRELIASLSLVMPTSQGKTIRKTYYEHSLDSAGSLAAVFGLVEEHLCEHFQRYNLGENLLLGVIDL